MKLYATIENEKGKREGIGGNEYLEIDIRVGNSPLCSLTLRWGESDEGVEGWTLYDDDDQPIFWLAGIDKKGNKQKGKKYCQYHPEIKLIEGVYCTKCSVEGHE